VPLIDTNVLFDPLTNDPIWVDWSLRQIDMQALRERLVINPVVYAEISISFDRFEEVDASVARASRSTRYRGLPSLSQAERTRPIAREAGRRRGCYPISSSAPMPSSKASAC